MQSGSEGHQSERAWSRLDSLLDGQFLAIIGAAILVGFFWMWWVEPQAGAFDAGITALIVFVVVFPVLEEFVFRGMIQRGVLNTSTGRRRYGPVSVANLVTTSVFALAHLPRGGWLLAAGVVIPSLCLGYFFERHHRLLSPIVMHVAFNLIATVSVIAIGVD